MTTLHDRLDDAVADVSADLPSLVAASRRRGLAIRRRRRALASVGAAAAVAVLAAGGWALAPGSDDAPVATTLDATPSAGPLSGATAPITSRGVAAALAAAVGAVADGEQSRLQGEAAGGEALAALLLEPRGGSGPAGQVFLNLRPAAEAGAAPYTCAGYAEMGLTDCASTRLPGGRFLRTYREDDDTELGRGSQRVVAEVVDPARRLRVVVFATNTNPWAPGRFRDQPALNTPQLVEIATRAWWSRTTLPREYVEAGQRLQDYSDASQDES